MLYGRADEADAVRVPMPLKNHGKDLIYFSKISRAWEVLENEIGPGN